VCEGSRRARFAGAALTVASIAISGSACRLPFHARGAFLERCCDRHLTKRNWKCTEFTLPRRGRCENSPVRYRGLLFGICAVLAVWQFMSDRPVSRAPGVLVEAEPEQREIEDPRPLEFKGVRLVPRARFKADVRVLSRTRYRLGKLAEIAPLDIAVGWGQMSDSAVLSRLDISQSNRFYYWHYDNEPPIAPDAIITHSANWHLIPIDDSTWRHLRGLRVGDVVTLEGELVDIEAGDAGTVRTSLSRSDSGGGACEVILVEAASRRSP